MKNTIGSKNFIKAAGLLLVTAVLILSSTAVSAMTQINSSPKANPNTRADTILLQEDFEGGVVPPEGWTITKYHSSKNWQIVDSTNYPAFVHSGTYAAAVFWDYMETSDEWLTTPSITISAGAELVQMDFWVYAWTLMTGATLKVIVNEVGQRNGDVIWDLIQDEAWETQEYRNVILNLTQYAGKTITLTWQYVGIVGPDIGLDDITVFEGAVPAPPIFDATMKKIQTKGIITVTISNIQTLPGGNATDVKWTLHAAGNAILKKINETGNGTIPFLAMGSSEDVSLDGLFGICALTITISITAPRAAPFEKTFKGLLLFRLVIIGVSG